MKQIEVRISLDGSEVTVDVNGAFGKQCIKDTEELLRRLGVTVKERKKSEYYLTETNIITESL